MAIPTRHSNPLNLIAGQRTFLVTSATWGRRRMRTLYEYRAQGRYGLHEFVVMPDHFHRLSTVGSGITIEHAVQFIKGGFAFRAAGNSE